MCFKICKLNKNFYLNKNQTKKVQIKCILFTFDFIHYRLNSHLLFLIKCFKIMYEVI